MRKLIKDSEGNVTELILADLNFMPPGWSEVPSEELDAEELAISKRHRMEQIRARRDAMLLNNDKQWLIAQKKAESTAAIEADAQSLRDLPEAAETALDALTTIEDVQAYDAFASLTLSQSYE